MCSQRGQGIPDGPPRLPPPYRLGDTMRRVELLYRWPVGGGRGGLRSLVSLCLNQLQLLLLLLPPGVRKKPALLLGAQARVVGMNPNLDLTGPRVKLVSGLRRSVGAAKWAHQSGGPLAHSQLFFTTKVDD